MKLGREPRIEVLSVEALIPYARNSRTHSDEQVAQIASSIREFGFTNPVLISADNDIIAGHGRVLAARKLGLEDVPCIRLDYLTAEQRRAYVIADNKLALNAGWDLDLLKVEFQELAAADFDLALTGFDQEEIEALLEPALEEVVGETDPDALPEDVETRCKPGDLWQLGDHRLLCGDATNVQHVDRLMGGQKADCIFTDPPYGYSYESNRYKGNNPHGMLVNDDKILDFLPCAYAALSENAAIYVCASHQTALAWRPLIDAHFTYKNLIVWKKNNWSMGDLYGAFAGQHELIFFAHKGRVTLRGERSRDVWEFDRDPPEHHPTQKPVELVSFAVSKVTDTGAAVLDLFGGSGSTLIACEKTRRRCYMMELDPAYCDVILARWEKFTGKQARRDDESDV